MMKCVKCGNEITDMVCGICGFDLLKDSVCIIAPMITNDKDDITEFIRQSASFDNLHKPISSITLSGNQNVRLMKDECDSWVNYPKVLGSRYVRASICSITFLDTLDNMPEDAWDVSEDSNGSVMAWVSASQYTDLNDLFIAANGEIVVSNCKGIFRKYVNLERIHFNGIFNTSQVTDMGYMFEDCTALKELDLSSFDTSQVTNMNGMFMACRALKELNLSSFDTSQVTDMGWMFEGCYALIELDLSRFDTLQVTDMNSMFSYCTALKELDLSSFDTSQVTDMIWMFEGCTALKELNLRDFNTSQVIYMAPMLKGCISLEKIYISAKWFSFSWKKRILQGCSARPTIEKI